MSDLDKNTKNILLGTLIGSAVGASLIILLKSSSHKGRKNTLHFIGKALTNAGEVIRDQLDDPQALLRKIDKNIAKNENKLADILELTAAGMELWKKLSK